jgi:hypothetical protein
MEGLDAPFLQQGSKEWHLLRQQIRQHGVTSSRFAAAIGVNPYKSRTALMREELKNKRDDRQTDAMLWGIDNEDYVRCLFEGVMRDVCKLEFDYHTFGFKYYAEDKRLGGSPDGLLTMPGDDTYQSLVEIKCTDPSRSNIRTTPPIYHLVQIIGLCAIFKISHAYYVCWSAYDATLTICDIEINMTVWHDYIYPALQQYCAWKSDQYLPPRMPSKLKRELTEAINEHCTIGKVLFTDNVE